MLASRTKPSLLAHSAALVGCLMLLWVPSPSAAGTVQIVDCENGPNFTIQQGIDAASMGDTVFIEPCLLGDYPPFEVVNRDDLTITGNGGRAVLPLGVPPVGFEPPVRVNDDPFEGPFNCVEVRGSSGITLSGMTFGNCGFHAIEVQGNGDVSILANRFDPSFETVRVGSETDIVGNLFVGGTFAIFVDGSDTLIANNFILDNVGAAISLLSSQGQSNVVRNNVIRGSGGEAIFSAGENSRIERNLCENNGGLAEIVLSDLSNGTIVAGNIVGGSISDSGDANVLVGNQ